jgi:hypothetical protein
MREHAESDTIPIATIQKFMTFFQNFIGKATFGCMSKFKVSGAYLTHYPNLPTNNIATLQIVPIKVINTRVHKS